MYIEVTSLVSIFIFAFHIVIEEYSIVLDSTTLNNLK